MNKSVITLCDVTKWYSTPSGAITVLQHLSAQFQQGTSYAITGASGSGKSTLLSLIMGFEKPSSGSIFFDSVNSATMSESERTHFLTFSIGLMFQSPHLIEELSIIENVMMPGLIACCSWKESYNRAQELLAKMQIQDKENQAPSQLSGGQQQRASLARALFNKPAFLLADEPTGNLDAQTGTSIIKLLIDCQKEWNMGLIISTHDESLARLMDKTYHLNQGIF